MHYKYPNTTIAKFYGNETLNETIKLFSNCKLLIAAHGAGLANMIFMKSNTIIIEIRPTNFPVDIFEKNSKLLHLKHYLYLCGKGRYGGRIPLKPYEFMPFVNNIIEKERLFLN